KRDRGEKQKRGGKAWRNVGGEIETDRARRGRRHQEAEADAVAERDPALTWDRGQSRERLDPHAHGGEMGRQDQFPQASARRPKTARLDGSSGGELDIGAGVVPVSSHSAAVRAMGGPKQNRHPCMWVRW